MILLALIGIQEAASAVGDPSTGEPIPQALLTRIRSHAADLEVATRPLRAEGDRDLQMRRLAGEKAPAALNALVMLCDFSDSLLLGRYGVVPGDFPQPVQFEIPNTFAAHDSVYFDYLLTNVAEYFRSVSGHRFTLNFTIAPGVVNLEHPMGFYGNHPQYGEQSIALARDVVAALDPVVDFSGFDTLILIHAGAGGETDFYGLNPEQIFSTYLGPRDFASAVQDTILESPWLAGDDFGGAAGIDRVLILPETEYQEPFGRLGSLGVYCFEVGLRLGMLSLTDFTPAGNVDSQGIGIFGLMGYGLYSGAGLIPPEPCAFNKYLVGWLDPQVVDPHAAGTYALTPAENPSAETASARVDINGQEYWLLEYRLQDPDGNGMFSFPGDLNHDGIPDFYDANSDYGNGWPTGVYDPQADTLESLAGAEWDFAMSANTGRPGGVTAAGSGVYIWHVDEGLIRAVYDAEDNLFNSDPLHKAVDLEEADGIQDLDSPIPSDYTYGGDDDSFRGEDNHEFGPYTRPGTESAAGAYTGIVLRDFSNVVADSQGVFLGVVEGDTLWGIAFADTIRFSVGSVGEAAQGPMFSRQRTLPGVDLRGSHVLVGDLDGGGTPAEIILAGHAGEVYALDGNLREYFDADGDSATVEPLLVSTRDGSAVNWNLPVALGDLDGDAKPEIVLTGPHGLYAFDGTGQPLVSGGDGFGLWADLPTCRVPPILASLGDPLGPAREDVSVAAFVIYEDNGHAWLDGFASGQPGFFPAVGLGPGAVGAPPTLAFGQWFLCALHDSLTGESSLELVAYDRDAPNDAPLRGSIALPVIPGPWPLTWGLAQKEGEEELRFVQVAGRDGSGATLFFNAAMVKVGSIHEWGPAVTVQSAMAPGGYFVGPDLLGGIGHGGDWSDGWPRRPRDMGTGVGGGGPLVAWLRGVDSSRPQTIFPLEDGSLIALKERGEEIQGWPVSGPGTGAVTPALGDLVGDGELDLVAAGSFLRITEPGADGVSLDGDYSSTVMMWRDVAAETAAWPMSGGGIWRNGDYDAEAWIVQSPGSIGSGMVLGSHTCYPNPLGEGPLYVRGEARSPGRARAFIYNLEGELVTTTAWNDVVSGDPFTLIVPLDGVATGMYISRLVVDAGGETTHSVVSFTVVR